MFYKFLLDDCAIVLLFPLSHFHVGIAYWSLFNTPSVSPQDLVTCHATTRNVAGSKLAQPTKFATDTTQSLLRRFLAQTTRDIVEFTLSHDGVLFE